ncbi:MAG TPA: hypothetical protein ENF17_01355 [Candidatus Aminicenantes bacterium]|nr:hypothetical protein [Candidatus Aminicenantes bacterium]
MKSITIHGLDDEMAKLIKKRAKLEKTSVNRIVKSLLAKTLGLGQNQQDNREEFLDLFGVWSETEAKGFFEAIKDLEQIYPEDWK